MAAYKAFAIAGGINSSGPMSGNLGSFFAKSLLKQGASVTLLVRSIGKPEVAEDLKQRGATIKIIDYNEPESLAEALVGIDVVISTLSGPGFAVQPALAKASKQAGVSLFVPSEFGTATLGVEPDSPIYGKAKFHGVLKELELPYTLFFTGVFSDFARMIFNTSTGKITIIGRGDAKVSTTARQDIADYLAFVLTKLKPEELANRVLRIEGSRFSFNELVEHANANSQRPLEVDHEPLQVAQKRYADTHDFITWMKVAWDQGRGVSATNTSDLDNHLFPDWQPKPIKDFL
ncbi:uncharacterized protein L969DRAFT_18679 [Mixia osmundae IAM 14324]|uniref:NmrA-like domain-containing protein n=1 Tax=Mixia osmundae (strain CBS 9802 / IAM 14324 / JCM 22182 / KY 12970) TaxID=764103 RepID=G7E0Q2_MIXOS|nr:uncharacterized protein L969DRAFT_18679 [Mixia osmundae IAM 14324]KEI37888.1 hypothetical protein L969DRAFT_18679 [Mixia osmundae IAM 14324]GAA96412.1 hypothetical protein E5Q_03079 [Mixia osmundae IAM 14324]